MSDVKLTEEQESYVQLANEAFMSKFGKFRAPNPMLLEDGAIMCEWYMDKNGWRFYLSFEETIEKSFWGIVSKFDEPPYGTYFSGHLHDFEDFKSIIKWVVDYPRFSMSEY